MTPQPVEWDYNPDTNAWRPRGAECPRCPDRDPYCRHPEGRHCPLDLRMIALYDRHAVGDDPGRC